MNKPTLSSVMAAILLAMKNRGNVGSPIQTLPRNHRGMARQWSGQWRPVVSGGVAKMKSGARYAVRKDGWRRLPDEVTA